MRSNNPDRQTKCPIVHIIERKIERIKNDLNLEYLVQYAYKKSFHKLRLHPKFQTASMNDLKREWKADDLLPYAYDMDAYFAVGTDVRYSNTNYILLGNLIEQIEGKPLHKVFEERIFQPLGMRKSLFASKKSCP